LKVNELIRKLRERNPNATVFMGNPNSQLVMECEYVIEDDEGDIILESINI